MGPQLENCTSWGQCGVSPIIFARSALKCFPAAAGQKHLDAAAFVHFSSLCCCDSKGFSHLLRFQTNCCFINFYWIELSNRWYNITGRYLELKLLNIKMLINQCCFKKKKKLIQSKYNQNDWTVSVSRALICSFPLIHHLIKQTIMGWRTCTFQVFWNNNTKVCMYCSI